MADDKGKSKKKEVVCIGSVCFDSGRQTLRVELNREKCSTKDMEAISKAAQDSGTSLEFVLPKKKKEAD